MKPAPALMSPCDRRTALRTLFAATAIPLLWPRGVHAAPAYPSHSIKLIVPFAPGGPNDVAARLIAPALSTSLGRPVVVTNIGGAGGRIGSKTVASSQADGYALMMGGTNLNVVVPAVYPKLNYDPVADFEPVGALASDPMIMAIHPGVPAGSVQDLIRYSRRNPGKLSAGSAPGIGPHFAIEMFKRRTGADITFVPYKGASPAIQDSLGGHLSMVVTNRAALSPLVRKNMLRALAVTGKTRLAEFPEVPTLEESGVQGVPSLNWYGLMAPARTPAPVLKTLRAALAQAIASPQMAESIRTVGMDPAPAGIDFAAVLAEQRREWAAITHETGITLE
ncbi:Bug family tripartite tricarboxylate transporter substrate binding protein [Variovorax sp. 278MFTsu5.1]|uniref:Bug family tripartite tricarboxylate transporter substrate binding protein n=1 Tax=Variovorax sp. 278MFTsu5.1 TaxID=3158366 RepID=UPI003AAD1CFB